MKQLFKKIFIVIFFFLVIFALWSIWKQTETHFQIANLQNINKDLNKQNELLVNENKQLEHTAQKLCEDNNILQQYLFFEGIDCEFILYDDQIEKQAIDIEKDFITFLDVFFINDTQYEHIQKSILEIADKDFLINQANDFLDIQKQFTQLIQNESIQKFLNDYQMSIEIINDSEFALLNQNTVLSTIYLNSQYQLIAHHKEHNKNIQLDNFSQMFLYLYQEKKNKNDQAIQLLIDELSSISQDNIMRENIVLLGKNGSNVDTIMLAAIDHTRKNISLISIPRDLWVDNKKINAYYAFFGMKNFLQTLSEITQQKIEKYVLIDMLAFPQVIDAIGGIQYTFEKPLIDPSYRTVDNGLEGTLYFPTGTQHLNGIQALRVARTRKTSSDFARSERQQNIMIAARQQIEYIRDPQKIFALAKILMNHIITDIEITEGIRLFSQIKNYTINAGNVMSTQNILQSQMYPLDNDRRVYILKPYDDKWEIIPQFIWKTIRE